MEETITIQEMMWERAEEIPNKEQISRLKDLMERASHFTSVLLETFGIDDIS